MSLLPEHCFLDKYVSELPPHINSIAKEILNAPNDAQRFDLIVEKWLDIIEYIENTGELSDELKIVNYHRDINPMGLVAVICNIQDEMNKYSIENLCKISKRYKQLCGW